MIKQIIFDMDGLMIDSERAMWIVNEKQALKEFNYEEDEEFLISLNGQGREYSHASFLRRYGNDFPIIKFYERIDELNKKSVEEDKIPLKDGLLELLDYLKDKDIKLTVGTSSNREYVELVLKHKGIYDRFEHVVCGSDVEHGKPDPDIYLKGMSYYNFDPQEVIVFEDADTGARAGLKAGARVIIVPDLGEITDEVKSQVLTIIDNLKQAIEIIEKEI